MENRLSVEDAVAELFDCYADEIYRYADYMLGNSSEAEDVVQEVFIRVVKYWQSFRYESGARTWLWTITRRCIQDAIKARKQQQRTIELRQPSVATMGMDSPIALEDSIRRLPLTYRQVVYLRIVEDQSTKNTAQILGWTQTKVKNTLHRAVLQLRKDLDDTGTPSDGSDSQGRAKNTLFRKKGGAKNGRTVD